MCIIFLRLYLKKKKRKSNPFPRSSELHIYHSVKFSEEQLEYHPLILYYTIYIKILDPSRCMTEKGRM